MKLKKESVEMFYQVWKAHGNDWWRHLQYESSLLGGWGDFTISDQPIFDRKLRVKKDTHTVNGKRVAAPFEPKRGELYWYINNNHTEGVGFSSCSYRSVEEKRSKWGGLFRTREDALENLYARYPEAKKYPNKCRCGGVFEFDCKALEA